MEEDITKRRRDGEGGEGQAKVRYVPWDFHAECGSLAFNNVAALTELIRDDIQQHGYFRFDQGSESPVKRKGQAQQANEIMPGCTLQCGTFRVNCCDSLDRTNVIQSKIAEEVLTEQLRRCGVFREREALNFFPDLGMAFRTL